MVPRLYRSVFNDPPLVNCQSLILYIQNFYDIDITIYGVSEEFGTCDKEFAAEMVREEFRERTIKVRD